MNSKYAHERMLSIISHHEISNLNKRHHYTPSRTVVLKCFIKCIRVTLVNKIMEVSNIYIYFNF